MLSFIIDPEAIADISHFHNEVDAFTRYVKESPPAREGTNAENGQSVLMPGDPERARLIERSQGINIDNNTWFAISEAARSVGVDEDLEKIA